MPFVQGVIALLLSLTLVSPSTCETYWRIPCAAAHAPVGTLAGGILGAIVAGDNRSSIVPSKEMVLGAMAGTVAGTVAGWKIGASADRRLASGQEIPSGHRNAIRLGTVLLGTAAGAAVGGLRINDPGDSGHDGRIVAESALAGLAAGVLLQVLLDRHLHPPASPTARLDAAGKLQLGAVIAVDL